MSQPHDNWLLLSLPESDQIKLRSQLQRVRLEKGRPLYRPGEKTEYAYFPLDCVVVSTVYIAPRTGAAEIAVTGREGVVGLELIMNDITIPRLATVHTSGAALRIRAEVLTHACAESRSMREVFLRYMQALVAQTMQLSICSQYHDLEQQFCRLILSRLDRVGGDEVEISHELLANALGAPMEKLTRLAMDFWSAGILDQQAGHIRVLDRHALEKRACECHLTVRQQYDRLLPGWRAAAAHQTAEAMGMTPLPGVDGFLELGMGEAAGD